MNNFLNIALLAETLLIAGCKQPVERPNVVFIICDQMSPRAMGWTGETEVRTPNLDELSNSAYCFKRSGENIN